MTFCLSYQFPFRWHHWVAPPILKSHWSIILDLIHQTSDWPAAWTNKSCLSGNLLHQASVTVNFEHFKALWLVYITLFANLSRNSLLFKVSLFGVVFDVFIYTKCL